MSVIATVEVPTETFILGDALCENPGIRVHLERIIPVGSTVIPYFWAANDDVDTIEAELQAESDIESFEIVDEADGEALVRVEWAEEIDGFLDVINDSGATIYEATGEANTWTFSLRFAEHDDLTEFYRECIDRGISLDLQTVHNPGLPEEMGLGLGVTDTQRETLIAAFDAGYFDVPRRINLTELADELGISDTAASQRIRRGVTALLVSTLAKSETGTDE